jgi:uncharacterized oxidoreductase
MDITGRTILIPGATSGIGLGLALRLHERGNTVIVGGRRTDLLERIAVEHPGIDTVVIDTTDPASIAAAQASVLAAHPDLDVLIPMAGIMLPEDLRTPEHLEVAERTVATNLLGPIRLIAAFTPHLLRQDAAAIITVSSGLAFVPLPVAPTYSATKAAIHSFTESLRVQLAGTPVQVVELVPPAVRTTLMGQQDAPMAMPLDAFLDQVMRLLEQDGTADEILVDEVGFLRNAPADGTYGGVLAMLSGVR